MRLFVSLEKTRLNRVEVRCTDFPRGDPRLGFGCRGNTLSSFYFSHEMQLSSGGNVIRYRTKPPGLRGGGAFVDVVTKPLFYHYY